MREWQEWEVRRAGQWRVGRELLCDVLAADDPAAAHRALRAALA